MMGCGIAHFGQRGLETTQAEKMWSKILSQGGFAAQGGFSGTASWNPYRRESKPLVAPQVQTPGNNILDQILSD